MDEKADLGLKVPKKGTSKKRKNEKMPKNSQFWACFGVFEQLNLVRLNFAVAVKLYFVHFLQIKMVGKLKSRGIACNQNTARGTTDPRVEFILPKSDCKFKHKY